MTHKLTDCNARILEDEDPYKGIVFKTLVFDCPKCENRHPHMVPYNADGLDTGFLIWKHTGGSTVADLSIAPSYWLRNRCNFHCFIEHGQIRMV